MSASLASKSRSCVRRRGRFGLVVSVLRRSACALLTGVGAAFFGALARGDAAAGAIHVQVAPRFSAVALDGQHQFQHLVGNDTRGVRQAAILADDGEALVERADGEPLLQQPLAEALEQSGRHAPPGFGILVEVLGLPLDASLDQVGREALERVTLGGASVVGLLGMVLGEGVGPARMIGSQTCQRQVVAVAGSGALTSERDLLHDG